MLSFCICVGEFALFVWFGVVLLGFFCGVLYLLLK